jgi:hypothetical protein
LSDKLDVKKLSYAFTVFEGKHLHTLATNADLEKTNAAVDSGASVHYCPKRNKFITYQSIPKQDIYAADGRPLEAIRKGDVKLNLLNCGELTEITLHNIYYVPKMTTTLISVACLDNARYFACFGQGMCCIEAPDRNIIAEIPLQHGL